MDNCLNYLSNHHHLHQKPASRLQHREVIQVVYYMHLVWLLLHSRHMLLYMHCPYLGRNDQPQSRHQQESNRLHRYHSCSNHHHQHYHHFSPIPNSHWNQEQLLASQCMFLLVCVFRKLQKLMHHQ